MDRTIDLTQLDVFQKPTKVSLLTMNRRHSIFNKFEVTPKDLWLIHQGDFETRKTKKISNHTNNNCYRCGKPLLPYNHDELCKACNEIVGIDEQVWFRGINI